MCTCSLPPACPTTLHALTAPQVLLNSKPMPYYLQGKEDRKKPAGLPVKTLDGEVVFQRPGSAAATGAAAVTAAAAGPAQLAVAGVTIQDDLEEALQREAERREAEEAAAEAREEEASRSRTAAANKGE